MAQPHDDQRWTTCTALSTLALSRGLRGGWHHRDTIVDGELLIGGVQVRLVNAGSPDAGFGVIGDEQLWTAIVNSRAFICTLSQSPSAGR